MNMAKEGDHQQNKGMGTDHYRSVYSINIKLPHEICTAIYENIILLYGNERKVINICHPSCPKLFHLVGMVIMGADLGSPTSTSEFSIIIWEKICFEEKSSIAI